MLIETPYKTILDSVADGVFTVDLEWRIASWNRAAEMITGFTKEEAIGRPCYEVFQTNICQDECVMRRAMKSGEIYMKFPITIITKDGDERPISISASILRDDSGKMIGGVETFRDLTAIESLRKELTKQYAFEDIISKSHKMQDIFKILPDIAGSESTVLIQGPSGSGKELFARALHNLSPRKEEAFVAVSCGALPDTLLESELFGFKRGAFTDAHKDKPGRFSIAEGGTLFLDEIGEISAALQVKLLRVLQEKTYEPLGATSSMQANVRIITATNRNLREEMAIGRFRDDLFYRLNVITLEIPSLSERREDIPLLVDHFIQKFNSAKGKDINGISQEVMTILMEYDFQGNVRELENIIEHAFILCKGNMITPECLPKHILEVTGYSLHEPRIELSEGQTPLEAGEAHIIRQVLAKHAGDRAKAAEELGIHRTTLFRKIKRYSITYPKKTDSILIQN